MKKDEEKKSSKDEQNKTDDLDQTKLINPIPQPDKDSDLDKTQLLNPVNTDSTQEDKIDDSKVYINKPSDKADLDETRFIGQVDIDSINSKLGTKDNSNVDNINTSKDNNNDYSNNAKRKPQSSEDRATELKQKMDSLKKDLDSSKNKSPKSGLDKEINKSADVESSRLSKLLSEPDKDNSGKKSHKGRFIVSIAVLVAIGIGAGYCYHRYNSLAGNTAVSEVAKDSSSPSSGSSSNNSNGSNSSSGNSKTSDYGLAKGGSSSGDTNTSSSGTPSSTPATNSSSNGTTSSGKNTSISASVPADIDVSKQKVFTGTDGKSAKQIAAEEKEIAKRIDETYGTGNTSLKAGDGDKVPDPGNASVSQPASNSSSSSNTSTPSSSSDSSLTDSDLKYALKGSAYSPNTKVYYEKGSKTFYFAKNEMKSQNDVQETTFAEALKNGMKQAEGN